MALAQERTNKLPDWPAIRLLGGLALMHRILRLPDVKQNTGLSRSTLYLRIAEGKFPKPVSLGGRAVGWLESEIEEWLRTRIEASRKAVVRKD